MKTYFRHLIAGLFERQVRRVIRRHRLKVVAVAGSVGKTSTKMAIATVLGEKYQVLVHQGNYNSEVGLPLSVFELDVPGSLLNPLAWAWRLMQSEWRLRRYHYQVLVLELGTDQPGDMARFYRYLHPDVGVMTAVAPEHMANFPGELDQVAAEELSLAAASKIFIANHDEIADAYRRRYINAHPRHEYYGADIDHGYSFKLESAEPLNGSVITVKHNGKAAAKNLPLGMLGPTACKAALAAYVVGSELKLSGEQLAAGVRKIRPVAGRLNPLPGVNGALLIDDTYNSSPDAALAALHLLADLPATGRRIAVLGSMNELGRDSRQYHETVGAAAAGLDLLVTIGDQASRWLGPAAVAAGLDPTKFKPADSPYAAGRFLQSMLGEGDIVLLKGSQNGVFAEEATKLLLRDPADAAKLVRQSAAWQRTKRRQFQDAE
ncbi:MAG TPA: Mur ligase family protein [Candidatus Saccharimonadia bacterium]